MAQLSAIGLSKRYGQQWALRDVSLAVSRGEFLTIVGPSGCGKSTLLRIVAGLEQADAGEVRLDGASLGSVAPRDRDIAMVFQSLALYPHKTVAQNIATPLEMRRLTFWERAPFAAALSQKVAAQRETIQIATRETAAMVGLDALLGRKPSQLSGGQRQRVAIARAIIRRARLTLMDEPFSGLEGTLREQLGEEVKRLHRTLGNTIIFVTHDAAEAMTLSDRIAVMNEGVIVEAGAPRDLYQDPGHIAVARLLGRAGCNLVPGQWIESTVSFAGACFPSTRASPGPGAVTVGFRAESIRITRARTSPQDIPASVDALTYAGSDLFIRLRSLTGDHAFVARSQPRAIETIAPGQRVVACIDERDLLVFDATGVRCRDVLARSPRETAAC
jgi:multiple sugar transport system ATP-binding protein